MAAEDMLFSALSPNTMCVIFENREHAGYHKMGAEINHLNYEGQANNFSHTCSGEIPIISKILCCTSLL